MTTDKQRATSLLQHYLKFGLEAAGYRWDSDNQSEVADIVDRIIDARNEPTPTTASTPAEPDMIQQAGSLLAMLQSGKPICHGYSAGSADDRTVVQASAILAVAAELRDIRNILAESITSISSTPCRWTLDDNYQYWTAECGLEWSIDEGSPRDNGMIYCPACGRPLESIMEDAA